jgi:hypothetical protein
MNKDSKRITTEIYEKLSEHGKTKMNIGDIAVAYFRKKIDASGTPIELGLEFTSLQNAIEEVASLKYVEFRNDIPVFEV